MSFLEKNGKDCTFLMHHSPPSPSTSQRKALPTGQTSTLPTDLFYISLGYTSAPTDAFFDPALPHIRNVGGRVVDVAFGL